MAQKLGLKKWFLSACAAVGVAMLGSSSVAHADLMNGWTFDDPNGTGASFDATVTTLELVGGNNGVAGDATYTQVATIGGTVAYDWTISPADTGTWDYHGYVRNGVLNLVGDNSGPGNGFQTFEVNEGEVFGFYVGTVDGELGALTVNYSNYSFTAIPEPSALAVLALGTVGGLALRRRRQE